MRKRISKQVDSYVQKIDSNTNQVMFHNTALFQNMALPYETMTDDERRQHRQYRLRMQ
jgi:hypothetical protein